jgi:hypothetical protein
MTAEALEKMQQAGVEVIRPDKNVFADRVDELQRGYQGTFVGNLIESIHAVK